MDLRNAHKLNQLLKEPINDFSSIHIAGTNGKGSVAFKIAKSLQFSGYRVGVYTSPHISSFRERIRINDQLIEEEQVVDLVVQIRQIVDQNQLEISFFEMITFLAFLYFSQQKVDIAIIETGLGGRLDTTNIITPLVSIITSVSLDHCEILGDTIVDIAKEKAAIIKPSIPVVLGSTVPEIVSSFARDKNSCIFKLHTTESFYDDENKNIASLAISLIQHQFPVALKYLNKGLQLRPACRFEIVSYPGSEDIIILDVAHNPKALKKVFEHIKKRWPYESIRVVTCLSRGKDLKHCFQIILDYAHTLDLINGTHPRLCSFSDQVHVLDRLGYQLKNSNKSMQETLSDTISPAKKNKEIVLITGSFFIMSEARKFLGFKERSDDVELNEVRACVS